MKPKVQQIIEHLPDIASSLLWGCLLMVVFNLYQAFNSFNIDQLLSKADHLNLKIDIDVNSSLMVMILFLYICLLFSKRYSLWSVLEILGLYVLSLFNIISITPIFKYVIGVLYFTRISYKLSHSMDERSLKGVSISLIQLIFPYL